MSKEKKQIVTHQLFRRVPVQVEAVQYDGEENTRDYLFRWSQGHVRAQSIDGFPITLHTSLGDRTVEVGDYVIHANGDWAVQTAEQFTAEYEPEVFSTPK
jgi:hypothetical protein